MLPKLLAILIIFGFYYCVVSVNGKSCKKVCVTVKKCPDDLCDEPLYPEYSKCEIKCDPDEITGTTGNVAINRHSLSDAWDEEEETDTDDNFFKINDDLRNDFSKYLRENMVNRKRDFDAKSRYRKSRSGDNDVIAVLIANDGDRDFGPESRNTAYKSSSIRSLTTHPFTRLQYHNSVTDLYPQLFWRIFETECFIRKFFSNDKASRKKNVEIIGLKDHPLDVIHPERARRVKRSIGKMLLDSLSALRARARAGLSASVARATGGSLGGSIAGSIGLKAGPGGILADITGRATGQATGFTAGGAGIAAKAGFGVGQPGQLLPGAVVPSYDAGMGASTSVGGGLGGAIAGSLGGHLSMGIGRGLPSIRASLDGGVSGQMRGYGAYQSNRWGGIGTGMLGGFGPSIPGGGVMGGIGGGGLGA